MSDSPAERVVKGMMTRDLFSQWLGVETHIIEEGKSVISMVVRDEMMNGFGIAHGGIAYALADSALAFASNAYGEIAVALNNSISYPAPVVSGDILKATCTEISKTRRTAYYDVEILKNDLTVVAQFRGMVYRTSRKHEF